MASGADQLVERLFEAARGLGEVHMVYVGDRIGLYAALADAVPARFYLRAP